MSDNTRSWDVFISHPSEDKDGVVRALAVALTSLGVSVWCDEFTLRHGDSLSRSIDKGLASSRFGLAVISRHFLQKPWPGYELRGLVAGVIEEDRVILPVWYGVKRRQVLEFSPSLADKVALRTEGLGAQDMAIQILRERRPDLYFAHPRSELERIASGVPFRNLQEELAEYRGPHCGTSLFSRIHAPVDPSGDDWDLREGYECGSQVFGGYIEPPCPSDPRFPEFEDYELKFFEQPREPRWPRQCCAIGKTDMARRLQALSGSFQFIVHGCSRLAKARG